MKFLLQAFLLTISFIFIYIWQNTILSNYTVIFIGSCIIVFLLVLARTKKNILESMDGIWTVSVLNTIIFLLIFATGSLTSVLFFLLYFLGFGIAFIFEPATVFIFVIGTIAVFFQDIVVGDIVGQAIKVGSVVIISPLAYFFAREFANHEKNDETLKQTIQEIKKESQSIIENENHLKKESLDTLTHIVKQAESVEKKG